MCKFGIVLSRLGCSLSDSGEVPSKQKVRAAKAKVGNGLCVFCSFGLIFSHTQICMCKFMKSVRVRFRQAKMQIQSLIVRSRIVINLA